MRQLFSLRSPVGPLLNASLATLALTAIHHAYGGIIYATPWRLHGPAVAAIVGVVLLVLARAYTTSEGRRSTALAGFMFAAVALVMPILLIGGFEGVYNHLVKNVLFFGGAPSDVMVTLFPPPKYEMPNDALFELTGIAQIVAAAVAAVALVRFVRPAGTDAQACKRAFCGSKLGLRCLTNIASEPVEVPDPCRLIHLQFRRFAGCPVCNLHLRSFAHRHEELWAAKVREVVVFHSPVEELKLHASQLPFAVIADPDKRLYREFGVESGKRALLDPRAWGAILVGVVRSLGAILRGREHAPALNPHGGRFGLPADFLIAPDGRIVACKHGQHVYDQWSVDEVLALVGAQARVPARARLAGATTP